MKIKEKMNRKKILILFSAAFLVVLTGCSAGHDYRGNRWDDAKDIFSLNVGIGFGVKVQVGPIQVDSGYNYASFWGLRHGEILPGNVKHGKDYHVAEGNIGVPLPFCNTDIFYTGKHSADRGKAYCAMTPILPFFILSPNDHSNIVCNHCSWKRKSARFHAEREKYRKLPSQEQKKTKGDRVPLTEEEKGKLYDTLNKENPVELSFDGHRAWYKYTDMEVVIALGYGFSVGFNPGELLDFLAGFGCLDLYRDDI